eukprot:1139776-Pelagomonas_calceolata.AAC.1
MKGVLGQENRSCKTRPFRMDAAEVLTMVAAVLATVGERPSPQNAEHQRAVRLQKQFQDPESKHSVRLCKLLGCISFTFSFAPNSPLTYGSTNKQAFYYSTSRICIRTLAGMVTGIIGSFVERVAFLNDSVCAGCHRRRKMQRIINAAGRMGLHMLKPRGGATCLTESHTHSPSTCVLCEDARRVRPCHL